VASFSCSSNGSLIGHHTAALTVTGTILTAAEIAWSGGRASVFAGLWVPERLGIATNLAEVGQKHGR
jgi:hypothetical protein